MASTCSSSAVASPGANRSSYDVFLSFRGEDTRNSFTDHLYEALKRAGLRTFRDNDEIDRGEELKPEIEKAIEESRASVVVLSENYATSTWCLDELWLILEQRRDWNHFVLPVFYHIDPSDVGRHNRTFAIEAKSSGRWTVHNVNRWKAALTEVAGLTGMVPFGPETKLLADIVDILYNKVDLKLVCLPPNLTGMDTRVKDIKSWLKQTGDEFLAIFGMGGSGKTTLAMYILNSNWRNFENVSFVENIDSRCKEPHGLLQLQEQLLEDILRGKNRKIPGVSRGMFKIGEALQMKRALIVLDDIGEQGQLVALLGTGKINSQSKIIITTRIYRDEWFKSRSWRCQKYKMKLLDDDESLKLLSLHAFGSKIPMEGFEELAVQAVQYCDGNPLALEVLGSNLSEKNTIPLWKSELNLLERDVDSGIQRVLIRSYNSLPYGSDRELFLHIACFFIGKDMDYVVKILEHDYSASSRFKTLTDRCLLSVSPNKKLMMHRLLQEMGRTIVREESPKDPAKRSRVWRNEESYVMLRKGKGSETIEGLALDMKMLREEKYAFKPSDLKTDSLKKMDNLKLLQLKYVQVTGSYENFSEHLRWFCWIGFHLRTIPSDLFMGNLVAMDMSYSKLEVFELPMVVQSLQILNLKDSHNLSEIRNISRLPNLETLILWNCHSLVRVCETIRDLTSLAVLNMTGCENLCENSCRRELINPLKVKASTSCGASMQQPSFPLPHSLERLFLKDCYLECTDYIPLSFSVQLYLQYLNLSNNLFEFLPDYNHLKNLRVLDLSLCSRLKWILCLPSTLAELFTYYCKSLEKITFQSRRFTLQEFGYEGCINLSEIEGFIKLVPIAKLDETDLGLMKWLKEYQNHEMCLAGDDELTIGRSCHVQMLYEFNIMSTSLPDIRDQNMTPEYISEIPSLSFEVPLCPKNKKLKGLNVRFKYTISGEDWAWFAKVSTTNGVDLMYNPKVFGKPAFGEVAIWLSYWPIGNTLDAGDKVNVSIAVMSGLEVLECGASLVYTDDEVVEETLKNNMDWVDLSGFRLSTGAHYLCRRDYLELMEVGRLTPDWFRILVGDSIDYTEVRGWRKTGRPQHLNQSFTELKTVRCIIHGPEWEEIYKITQMSKSSFVDKTMELISSTLGETMKSDFSNTSTKVPDMNMSKACVVHDTIEFTSSSLEETMKSAKTFEFSDLATKAVDMDMEMSEGSVIDETMESMSTSFKEEIDSATSKFNKSTIKEEIYKITEMPRTMELISSTPGETVKSASTSDFSNTTKAADMDMSIASVVDETIEFTSSSFEEIVKSGKASEFSDSETKGVDMDMEMSEVSVVDEAMESTSSSLKEEIDSATSKFNKSTIKDLLDHPPVASPSSSTVASRSEKSSSFDVYLSFDILHDEHFEGDLSYALMRAGHWISPRLRVPPAGGHMRTLIGLGIVKARTSIIVLSKGYANSSWCLDELLLILKRKRNFNHFVLPLFYGVDSSDVREHQKTFALHRFQTSMEWMGKVDRWKAALTEVATLPGINVPRDYRGTSVIDEIVSIVHHAIYSSPLSTPSRLNRKDTQGHDTK